MNYFYTLILGLLLTFNACSLIQSKEKKAIEICQKAKVQVAENLLGFAQGMTWLDYANMLAEKENKKYEWKAEKTADYFYEDNIYIVSFVDRDGWGRQWEVDVAQDIVRPINGNEYLNKKYGFSHVDQNDNFPVKDNEKGLKLDGSDVVYIIKGTVANSSKKVITSASLDGTLKLIFKDKTINGKSNYESGFVKPVSTSSPWKPDESREFIIKTSGIENIYLSYRPDYVVFDLSLDAEDPVGYTFNKDIEENDLKKDWLTLKQ